MSIRAINDEVYVSVMNCIGSVHPAGPARSCHSDCSALGYLSTTATRGNDAKRAETALLGLLGNKAHRGIAGLCR